MGQVDTANFIDKIYNEMEKNDYSMSLSFVKIKYEKIFFEEIAEDYIRTLLIEDERFIFLNENQFILRNKLEDLISTNDYDIDQIEEHIKNKYFVRNIDKKALLAFKQDNLQLKFGDKIYQICDINSFYDSVRQEGFISFNAASTVSEHLNADYHTLLEKMLEMGVRIDYEDKFQKKCFVISEDNDEDLDIKIIDNAENILLVNFYSNEFIAAILVLYLVEEGYMEGDYYLTNRHINGLYKMNIIEKYEEEQGIKLTNIGKKLIKDFGVYLSGKIYIMNNLVDEVSLCKDSRELSKSKTIKGLDSKDLWESISLPINQIYKHNEYSKLLMELVYAGNKNGNYNLGDILRFNLLNGKREEVYKVFIGDRATSGIKPIKENKDICLKCEGYKCSKNLYISKTKLLHYRCNYVNEYIDSLSEDLTNLDMILKDPLIIKFLVPYNLTSKNKVIMKNIDILGEGSNVLHKKDGEYCPFKDIWILKEKYDGKMVQKM